MPGSPQPNAQGRPELPPLYYLHNFETLWRITAARYSDLLLPQEALQMRRFEALPQTGRCLYVRLALRRGTVFRFHRLNYPEIGDLEQAVRSLEEGCLAGVCHELDIDTLGRLFTQAEIRQSYRRELAGVPAANKAELLAAVARLDEDGRARADRLCRCVGERLIQINGAGIIDVLQLLFFGNSRQSLTDFVLSDLGVANYWPYALTREQRVFSSRDQVDAHRQADVLAERHAAWQESRSPDDLAALAADALLLESPAETTARRIHRLRNRVARDCERLDLPDLALRLYSNSEEHPARERRLRVLEAQGHLQDALVFAGRVLKAPWCEDELAAARTIRQRLLRRLYGRRQVRPRDRFQTHLLTLPRSGQGVERCAAQQLEREGWAEVRHVENSLFNGLFGLAFWDELFAAVPGAFHHPFQAGPSDMFSSRFRVRRRGALERRLQVLAACDLEAELLGAYRRCAGYQCRWTDWRMLTPSLVQQAVRCIPFRHLVAVWRRLLFDPRENRRGQPDLVAFGGAMGRYELWEVKGPGDVLQPHQRRWLDYLCDVGVPAGLLKVVWDDD